MEKRSGPSLDDVKGPQFICPTPDFTTNLATTLDPNCASPDDVPASGKSNREPGQEAVFRQDAVCRFSSARRGWPPMKRGEKAAVPQKHSAPRDQAGVNHCAGFRPPDFTSPRDHYLPSSDPPIVP